MNAPRRLTGNGGERSEPPGKRSAQRPKGAEATGIAVEIARRAIGAESPAAKRVAQNHRKLVRAGTRGQHHRRARHLHCRRDRHGRHHRRRQRHRCPHDGAHLHRRRHQSAARIVAGRFDRTNRDADMGDGIMADAAGTLMRWISPHAPALMKRTLLMLVPRTSGGAAAERAARSAARDVKASAGGGGVRTKLRSRAALPGARSGGATRPVMAGVSPSSPGCRAPSPCRRGWQ